MRILYGVVGEGLGHAMRSRVILEHLLALGHEVVVMASGRAADYLKKKLSNIPHAQVNKIHGFHIIYEDNQVRRAKTFWSNIVAGTMGLPENISAYINLVDEFSPQLVISDFESWVYFYAQLHSVPVISIDNMQVLNRCVIPDWVKEGHTTDYKIAKNFVASKLPFCHHYLITSFVDLPVRKKRTELIPPILRNEIIAAKQDCPNPHRKHVLVYQTAEGYGTLCEALKKQKHTFKVYGMRRDIAEPHLEGNVTFCPFSESQFIEDLAQSDAVISGGGFTVMSEAVYLHKPMLSIPVQGQYEQVFNARLLQHAGYGLEGQADALDESLEHFFDRLPTFKQNISAYHQEGNAKTFAAVIEQIDRVTATVY